MNTNKGKLKWTKGDKIYGVLTTKDGVFYISKREYEELRSEGKI